GEKLPRQAASKGKAVLATVKGDVHDIGKNIVKVVLESYGFEVVDLGKDVPPEKVLAAVKEHQPLAVGLSALMTTTVCGMEETIKLIKPEGTPVIVGGAVLSREIAEKIGADYYAGSALETVKILESLRK
ncbi:MAG: cobalamin-dependent protein, partial [Clostridiales bacterium]|nr:cobalamin-dependent protein [Clostridiales bacterium]